jgi:NAD-dependent SIR2 family protein deacetylase
MKPHCMFFDEVYSEHYYRKKTVERYLEDCDALIVVGTALATSFAKKIVQDCINREDIPVVEINLESCIDRGYVI